MMIKLKGAFIALSIMAVGVVFSGSAFADPVPNCWDDGDADQASLVDGSFIIFANTKPLTKGEFLELLDRASGKHIQAADYPIIFDENVIIVVQAVDYGVGEHKLTREALKKTVHEELQPISDTKGVSISCNFIMRPLDEEK